MNSKTDNKNNIIPSVCAWCKKKLTDFEHPEDTKVSHGICEECEKKRFNLKNEASTFKKIIIVAIKKILK